MKLETYLDAEGLTYAAFGKMVGVSHVTVHRWVKEAARPSWENLARISAVTADRVGFADFAPAPVEAT